MKKKTIKKLKEFISQDFPEAVGSKKFLRMVKRKYLRLGSSL